MIYFICNLEKLPKRDFSELPFLSWRKTTNHIYYQTVMSETNEEKKHEWDEEWEKNRIKWNTKSEKQYKSQELKSEDDLKILCKELKNTQNLSFFKPIPLETLIVALDAMWDFDEDEDVKGTNKKKKTGHKDFTL